MCLFFDVYQVARFCVNLWSSLRMNNERRTFDRQVDDRFEPDKSSKSLAGLYDDEDTCRLFKAF